MTDILQRTEDAPATYPVIPQGLHERFSLEIDTDYQRYIWQRLEAYIAHRWTPRTVAWVVQGEGSWKPDLTPFTFTSSEIWQDESWGSFSLSPSPVGGYEIPDEESYRITCEVGAGDPPEAVWEAFIRLANYCVSLAVPGNTDLGTSVSLPANVTTFSFPSIHGDGDISFQRSANWLARAMQNSGAADLLRRYRRAS